MGSDDTAKPGDTLLVGFNSRSRMGSDHQGFSRTHLAVEVSIRAPAWGATRCERVARRVCGVSIRAPAWGATLIKHLIPREVTVSIRAPAWGATEQQYMDVTAIDVSIRAPAWGATSPSRIATFKEMVSIRAPAWGATCRLRRGGVLRLFQFALPHGERPITPGIARNSR